MSSETRAIRKNILAKSHALEVRFPREFAAEVVSEAERILSSPLQEYSLLPQVSHSPAGIRILNIHFRQIFELLFRARCLRDVFWLLSERRIGSYKELLRAVSSVPWELVLPPGRGLSVRVRSIESRLFHETGISEAVSDYFGKKGFVPVRKAEADFLIECNIQRNRMRLLLGCFGRPGNERGYKTHFQAIAPIKSELAACLFERLITLDGFSRKARAILVPFAGSGTLAIEGLLALNDLPGGIFGRRFVYEEFLCASPSSNAKVRERSLTRAATASEAMRIVAIERSPEQVAGLRANVSSAGSLLKANAGSELLIECEEGDYSFSESKFGERFVLPLNPPYGARLTTANPREYRTLGEWVGRFREAAFSGFLLAPTEAAAKNFLQAAECRLLERGKLRNGGLGIEGLFFGS